MALPKLGSPKHFLTLPSNGKEIEYRPYTVKEEKMILMAVESKDTRATVSAAKDLIEACTFGEVNVSKLPMVDFEYMFLMLRAKSVGETADLSIGCTECEARNPCTVDIESVSVKGEIKEQIKVQVSDSIGVVMTYPTVGGIEKQMTKKGNKSDYEQTVATIASCIDTIYDEDNVYPAADHTPEELKEFVESFSSSQFKKVLEEFKDLPSIYKDVEFTCNSCGHKNEITLEGLQSFF